MTVLVWVFSVEVLVAECRLRRGFLLSKRDLEMRDMGGTGIHLLHGHRFHGEKTVGGRGPQENFTKEKNYFRGLGIWGLFGTKWRVSHKFSSTIQVIVHQHLKGVKRARMDRVEGEVRVIFLEAEQLFFVSV